MITLLKYIGIISALLAVTSFMPNVVPVGECNTAGCVTLPSIMEEALIFFVSTINAITTLMPWLDVVWNIILWGFAIKVTLFTWSWLKWFIELIR